MIELDERRAAAHAASRDAEARRSKLISRLRLATFLPAAAGLVWALTGSAPWPVGAIAVVLLAAFAALVVWHARVDERMNWFDALHIVKTTALHMWTSVCQSASAPASLSWRQMA